MPKKMLAQSRKAYSRADSVTHGETTDRCQKSELGTYGLKSDEKSCRVPLVQSTDGRCNFCDDLLPNRFSVTRAHENEQYEAHVHYYTGYDSSNLCDHQTEKSSLCKSKPHI